MQAEGTAYSEAQRQAVMFDKMSAIFVTICLVSVAFEFANSNQFLFMEAVEIGLVTPLLIGERHMGWRENVGNAKENKSYVHLSFLRAGF